LKIPKSLYNLVFQLDYIRQSNEFSPRVTFAPLNYSSASKAGSLKLFPQSSRKTSCNVLVVYLQVSSFMWLHACWVSIKIQCLQLTCSLFIMLIAWCAYVHLSVDHQGNIHTVCAVIIFAVSCLLILVDLLNV